MAPMLPCTPLVPSRSLGRLLGLDRLAFKLEGCQPAGSWLDRGAALVVAQATGARGLLAIGPGPLGPALALQATRAGLPVHLFVPTGAPETPDVAWAAAFGARIWRVAAERAELRETLPDLAAAHGWRYIDQDDPCLGDGMASAVAEIMRQQNDAPFEIVATAGLLGAEGDWLSAATGEATAVVAGILEGAAPADTASAGDALVSVSVTVREADAARRLLAREEGLIASRRGVLGLAALLRARRERPLSKCKSAVVLLANEIGGAADGPPVALDEALADAPLTIDALRGNLWSALLRRPG